MEFIEGNLKAVYSTSVFGGTNMWNLYIMTTNGWFSDVQWMHVSNIQKFFKTELPKFEEVSIHANEDEVSDC
jgi:hypothetical protein